MAMEATHTAVTATAMARGAAKAAELACGQSAIILGGGLALLVPDVLRGDAIPILVAGLLVQGSAWVLTTGWKQSSENRSGGSGRSSGSAGSVWAWWPPGRSPGCSQPEAPPLARQASHWKETGARDAM